MWDTITDMAKTRRSETFGGRLRTEIANQEAEIARLDDVLRREADGSNRRARLADVLANGPTILQDADPTRANAWLRRHLRAWVQAGKVVLVEWL